MEPLNHHQLLAFNVALTALQHMDTPEEAGEIGAVYQEIVVETITRLLGENREGLMAAIFDAECEKRDNGVRSFIDHLDEEERIQQAIEKNGGEENADDIAFKNFASRRSKQLFDATALFPGNFAPLPKKIGEEINISMIWQSEEVSARIACTSENPTTFEIELFGVHPDFEIIGLYLTEDMSEKEVEELKNSGTNLDLSKHLAHSNFVTMPAKCIRENVFICQAGWEDQQDALEQNYKWLIQVSAAK